MRGYASLAFVIAAGCADSGNHTVTIDLFYPGPTLVAYREGTGPWKTPDTNAMGGYVIKGNGQFELVAVTVLDNGAFVAEQLEATYADSDHWVDVGAFVKSTGDQALPWRFFDDPCTPLPLAGGPPVQISGRMLQPGTVDMDASCQSATTAPWNYALNVTTGTHSLLATGGGRFVLQRSLSVASAMTLPDIDLSAGGAMTTTPVLVQNADQNQVAAIVNMYSPTERFRVSSSFGIIGPAQPLSAPIIPPSALLVEEGQVIEVHSPGGAFAPTDRAARALFTGSPPGFALLAPPTVQIDASSGIDVIALQDLGPQYNGILFGVQGANGSQIITASKAWLDATKAEGIQFDIDAPGYDPTWIVDRTMGFFRSFAISDDSTDVTYVSRVNG